MQTFFSQWRQLSLLQKISSTGLVMLALSLPLALIGSAQQTRIQSNAASRPIILSEEQALQNQLNSKLLNQKQPIDSTKPPIIADEICRTAGCNGELCIGINDPNSASICQYKEEYACYQKFGRCEFQKDKGLCGWTPNTSLESCLIHAESIPLNQDVVQQIEPQYDSVEKELQPTEINKVVPGNSPDVINQIQTKEKIQYTNTNDPINLNLQTLPTKQTTPSTKPYELDKPSESENSQTQNIIPESNPNVPVEMSQNSMEYPNQNQYQYEYDQATEVKSSCTPRPACLDAKPPCQLMQPINSNWCPPLAAEPTPIPLPTPKQSRFYLMLKRLFGLQ